MVEWDTDSPLWQSCRFYTVVCCGNLHEVQRLLRDGLVDVHLVLINHSAVSEWGSGWTAIQLASCFGHLRIMRVLLEHGANVNHLNIEGETALHLSVAHNKIDATRLLLEHGADPNIQKISGWVALHRASFNYDVDHIRVLIENGATVDLRDDMGRTPLHVCVSAAARKDGDVDVARLLLESGSNPNSKDNEGNSIFWTVCLNRTDTMVRLLLQHGAAITISDKNPLSGETILHKLAGRFTWPHFSLQAKIMEMLLEHGANPRIRNNQGKLPLDVACAWVPTFKFEGPRITNVIYLLFQRMIGDASLSFKKQK